MAFVDVLINCVFILIAFALLFVIYFLWTVVKDEVCPKKTKPIIEETKMKTESCCCTQGHKAPGYLSLENKNEFLTGSINNSFTYLTWVPSMKFEFVCERCNAVVRTSQKIEGYPEYIIQQMGYEIGRLKQELAEKSKPKKEK